MKAQLVFSLTWKFVKYKTCMKKCSRDLGRREHKNLLLRRVLTLIYPPRCNHIKINHLTWLIKVEIWRCDIIILTKNYKEYCNNLTYTTMISEYQDLAKKIKNQVRFRLHLAKKKRGGQGQAKLFFKKIYAVNICLVSLGKKFYTIHTFVSTDMQHKVFNIE